MLHADARENGEEDLETPLKMNTITAEVVAQIEAELDSYDIHSLVFLLYDVPDTALQKLTAYQRTTREDSNMNLLSSWARDQQHNGSNWRGRFLEVLAICQLYNIIRKLGFNVAQVKKFYCPDNLHHHVHVNLMKKALYKLCENIRSEELIKLKKALLTYECDTRMYDNCESVLLKLMSEKKITVPYLPEEKCKLNKNQLKYDIDLLAEIVENFSGLRKLTSEIRYIQSVENRHPKSSTSTSSATNFFDGEMELESRHQLNTSQVIDEVDKLISRMTLGENSHTSKSLKCDKQNSKNHGGYKIKDPNRVGVCYIINQVEFYPSKQSISMNKAPNPLKSRHGSDRDCQFLKTTFESLKFEVIAHKNLDHVKIKEFITRNIIEYRVQPTDSMFVLCILSHGVKGSVYSADSVQIKVEDIMNWIDNSLQQRKLDIPKLMILQACQVNNEHEAGCSRLVADSSPTRYLRKAHFLVYWATAPELEAYRDEQKGSVFIQILCRLLTKYAKEEDIFSIFTKVTKLVSFLCKQLKKDQTPIFESTLMEKLHLQEHE